MPITEQWNAASSALPALDPRPPLYLVALKVQVPLLIAVLSIASQACAAPDLCRVAVIQFLKGGVAQGPEAVLTLCDHDLDAASGDERLSQPASASEPATIEAVEAVWAVCRAHLACGDLDRLVLDELGLAITWPR